MRPIITLNALWGAVVGGLLSISIPVFFVVVACLWLSVFIQLVRGQPGGRRWHNGLVMFAAQGIAMMGVLTAAALAPMKTADRLLELPVSLPRAEMTLGDLREYSLQRRVLALRSVRLPPSEAATVVRWPAEELTLRKFVAAIEDQTPLRHRFLHCMNYTVLWGGDCAFGLELSVPSSGGPAL